ncbi:unnamed protein product [Notodromas monacha]|uniref:MAU2 chromatid cohesion factor homolog n=1 Tax=Notodromas monacha TaxID=399045 RepID=A0A7R9G916_9CRUS|nr:unnamed protein product [Notodromas monacha]CAG0913850.1 unnamed protein product [Notodromas monacha]
MDSWYLALLGLAEHFRTIKPPDYRRCIQCLMAVFHAKPPPKVEARTHLQLGTILYTHTKNIDLAKTHLEQAWLLSQNLTSFDDVKFEAASLLAEVTEHLHQDALDAASSAAALPGAPGSNDAKAILRKALELSQATHVYWHCRLLFQLAQMHAKEKDYASALGLLGVGIDYSQGSSAQFTRILFTLSKAMLLLTSGGMVEAADVLNQGGTFLEAFTGSSHQKEYLKVFFLVLQVCHYLMVGQVKSVKPGLKQLQQSVQTITQPNWPNDEDLASATCIADNFMWLPKEHMCVLVYLVTISHSMQAGYMEKAQKYSEKALAQVEKMKGESGDKRPLLLNFQRMILEHMVLCQLVMGHRGLALRELNNLCHLLYFPDTNSSADKALKKYLTQLRRSTRPQMHALLGLCAMSLDELDIAERQFATAVQGSNVALATKPELIVFVHLNMAIIRLMKSQMQGNPQQIVSNEDAEIVERLADPERIPQHSHGLRAAGLYVRGLHAFLGGRFNEAKSFLRDTLKMANAEDLNRLTSISLVLLGHIFLALNNSRESSNMVTPAMQLASKIPDATIQLWAASIQRRLYRVCGDTNREQECLNLAQGFSQGLSRDQEEAKVLPEHALLLWLGDTDAAVKPPPFVPAGNAQEPPGHPRVAPGPASNPHLSMHVAMAASSPSSSASASPSSSSSSGVRHQMMHNPHLLAHHQTHISHQTQSVAQVQQLPFIYNPYNMLTNNMVLDFVPKEPGGAEEQFLSVEMLEHAKCRLRCSGRTRFSLLIMLFHAKCGRNVILSEDGISAERLNNKEFNDGIVFSESPLKVGVPVNVLITETSERWTGGIKIGVVGTNPSALENVPVVYLDICGPLWLLVGDSVLEKGMIGGTYDGPNLDDLDKGDVITVKRTSDNRCEVNVRNSQTHQIGSDLPPEVFLVVELYGRCTGVRLLDSVSAENRREVLVEEPTISLTGSPRFHPACCGLNVKLSSDRLAACRRSSDVDYANGVLFTEFPLKPDEIFRVRVDGQVDKWTGNVEIGVSLRGPDEFGSDFPLPVTMTRLTEGGVVMFSSRHVHFNGSVVKQDYSSCDLDELQVDDEIGVSVKSNGAVHFYVDGVDQGCAFNFQRAEKVWGVVDMFGKTNAVKIMPASSEISGSNNCAEVWDSSSSEDDSEDTEKLSDSAWDEYVDSPRPGLLLNHQLHGKNAAVCCNGKSAFRMRAEATYNEAVVVSQRPLRSGVTERIRINRLVPRWEGSLEIGVIGVNPSTIAHCGRLRSLPEIKGCEIWTWSGASVFKNREVQPSRFSFDLDNICEAATIGIKYEAPGSIRFFVGNVDVGIAFTDLPQEVWLIADLYGKCAAISIVTGDYMDAEECNQLFQRFLGLNDDGCCDSDEPFREVRLEARKNSNVCLTHNNTLATRHRSFTRGVVLAEKPLTLLDPSFGFMITKVENSWPGSFTIGVIPKRFIPDCEWNAGGNILLQSLTNPDGFGVQHNKYDERCLVAQVSEPYMSSVKPGCTVELRLDFLGISVFIDDVMLGLMFSLRGYTTGDWVPFVDLHGSVVQVKTFGSIKEKERLLRQCPFPVPVEPAKPLESHPAGEIRLIPMQCITMDVQGMLNMEMDFEDAPRIVLSENGTKALRIDGIGPAWVALSQPIIPDLPIRIRIDSVDESLKSSLVVGFIWGTSMEFPQPVGSVLNRGSNLMVARNSIFMKKSDNSNYTAAPLAESLEELKSSDVLEVLFEDEDQLYVYLNRSKLLGSSPIRSDNCDNSCSLRRKPLWMFINLYGRVRGVTVGTVKDSHLLNGPQSECVQ